MFIVRHGTMFAECT